MYFELNEFAVVPYYSVEVRNSLEKSYYFPVLSNIDIIQYYSNYYDTVVRWKQK